MPQAHILQVYDPNVCSEYIRKGAFAIPKRLFINQIPARIKDICYNSLLFLRLKIQEENYIYGPFVVTSAPRGIRVIKIKNAWHFIDISRTDKERLPANVSENRWILFFEPQDDMASTQIVEPSFLKLPDFGLLTEEQTLTILNLVRKKLCDKNFDKSSAPEREMDVVLTLPFEFRERLFQRINGIKLTSDVFGQMFADAQHYIKIFSPYVDATFVSFTNTTSATIKIVTTAYTRRGRRPQPNPLLERCSQAKNVYVRYLVEKVAGAQIYQVHAKMCLIDGKAVYIGSANLMETSLHSNLEIGVLIKASAVVSILEQVFDFIWDKYAVVSCAL